LSVGSEIGFEKVEKVMDSKEGEGSGGGGRVRDHPTKGFFKKKGGGTLVSYGRSITGGEPLNATKMGGKAGELGCGCNHVEQPYAMGVAGGALQRKQLGQKDFTMASRRTHNWEVNQIADTVGLFCLCARQLSQKKGT